jgi:hypothetical protein
MPTNHGKIAVFLGPTLPRAEAEALLDATYLPPVEQGSVAAVVERRPEAIVIIDGYFGWVPSVWHKEILWALSEGTPVFGASSMGALRAAELHPFGMIGYGRVFGEFAKGRLHDDDEVAVTHADAEHGFRAFSDAMVNVRATLAKASSHEVINASAVSALVDQAKTTFFPDRQLARLVDVAGRSGLISRSEHARLSAWLPANFQDVKADDARGLLLRLAGGWRGEPRIAADFTFQSTVNWLQLLDAVRRVSEAIPSGGSDDVLTECRVAGQWPAIEAMALVRLLVGQLTGWAGQMTDDEYVSELARLCVSLGLDSLDDVLKWLDQVGWDGERLIRFLDRESRVGRAREYNGNDLRDAARDVLVLSGAEAALAERGRRKRAWLDALDRSTLVSRDPSEAIEWFRSLVGSRAAEPEGVLASRHGWSSVSDMKEDLLCEYAFRSATDAAGGAAH